MSSRLNPLSVRVPWDELPASVRSEIERLAGARVTRGTTIEAGFSPGLIARLETADGRSLFVKACATSINPRTPLIHAREARVLGLIAGLNPVPFLGEFSCDGWTGVVTLFVSGSQPVAILSSTDSLFDVVDTISSFPLQDGIDSHADLLANDFLWFGVAQLIERDGTLSSPWGAANAVTLLRIENDLLAAVEGQSLIHGDLRADNVIVSLNGVAVAIDWPAAAVGNPLFDVLTFATSLALEGHREAADIATLSRAFRTADSTLVTTLLVGLFGHYRWAASLDNPPGIPGVRAYQARLAAVLEQWLTTRI